MKELTTKATKKEKDLRGLPEGWASACDLTLDTHRCAALIVLDRWSTLVGALGPHLGIGRPADVIPTQAPLLRFAKMSRACCAHSWLASSPQ